MLVQLRSALISLHQIEPVTLSMKEYLTFVASVKDEIAAFKEHQAKGTAEEEAR